MINLIHQGTGPIFQAQFGLSRVAWVVEIGEESQKKSADGPELIALMVPEARRLLVRLLWSCSPEADAVLEWSEWRRAH